MTTKTKVYIIDTSALLSGKPIHIQDGVMITTPGVSAELKPGGRDYRTFELLQEKGLTTESPSKESTIKVKKTAQETGDLQRLSPADIEILALALDIKNDDQKEPIILTDDYSIQNIAHTLSLSFQNMSQRKITKKFKWLCRCPGCGKQLTEPRKTCPVCGTETRLVPQKKQTIQEKK